MSGRPTVFLDRDGVLNELVPQGSSGIFESPLREQDVSLIAGAAAGAARLAQAGFRLACVSNQPAAAKGAVSVGQLLAVHARVAALLAELGVCFAEERLCLHHPEGTVPHLTGACSCRKPAPGMLLDAGGALGSEMVRSWMVGDTDADVEAGAAAGCRTMLIENPRSAHKRMGLTRPDACAASLFEGASKILAAGGLASDPPAEAQPRHAQPAGATKSETRLVRRPP
jgi:D-glycero-D-manno-heptose 1,7-bisphosphate phosphatase